MKNLSNKNALLVVNTVRILCEKEHETTAPLCNI